MTVTNEKIAKALEVFLENEEDFADAIIKATVAGFSGSGFSVELFQNEPYRVIWNDAIGNRHTPKGRILNVGKLSDEDYRDLCEVAGSSDPDELAKELAGSGMAQEMAQEMRDGFADDEAMRQEWAEEVAQLAPEYKEG